MESKCEMLSAALDICFSRSSKSSSVSEVSVGLLENSLGQATTQSTKLYASLLSPAHWQLVLDFRVPLVCIYNISRACFGNLYAFLKGWQSSEGIWEAHNDAEYWSNAIINVRIIYETRVTRIDCFSKFKLQTLIKETIRQKNYLRDMSVILLMSQVFAPSVNT